MTTPDSYANEPIRFARRSRTGTKPATVKCCLDAEPQSRRASLTKYEHEDTKTALRLRAVGAASRAPGENMNRRFGLDSCFPLVLSRRPACSASRRNRSRHQDAKKCGTRHFIAPSRSSCLRVCIQSRVLCAFAPCVEAGRSCLRG